MHGTSDKKKTDPYLIKLDQSRTILQGLSGGIHDAREDE